MLEQNVDVAIEETIGDSVTKWYGTITVRHLTGLVAGQRYRLTLDDGRTGEFVVRRNTVAGGDNRAVAVRGTGPLAPRPGQ